MMTTPDQTIYCAQTCNAILKLVGVYPNGINRLHDAIREINREPPFKSTLSGSANGQIEILASKYAPEHKSYTIEIGIPYQVHTGGFATERKVPQSALLKLFEAVNEFQPQQA
jgi:hypothetical protein